MKTLLQQLISQPILSLPCVKGRYIVYTDACEKPVRVISLQKQLDGPSSQSNIVQDFLFKCIVRIIEWRANALPSYEFIRSHFLTGKEVYLPWYAPLFPSMGFEPRECDREARPMASSTIRIRNRRCSPTWSEALSSWSITMTRDKRNRNMSGWWGYSRPCNQAKLTCLTLPDRGQLFHL